MSKPVLVYFNVRGRGEEIRLVLNAAGVDFEDRRIAFDDWPAEKPKTPTGVLPFITMPDGKVLTESLAIARYFAYEHGFMGNGHWDIYLIERAIGSASDVLNAWVQVVFRTPEAEKEAKKEEFISGKGRSCLTHLAGFISEAKGDFILGDKVSLADFSIMNTWALVKKNTPDLAKEFPSLDTHHEAVCKKFPKVAEYIASRPESNI